MRVKSFSDTFNWSVLLSLLCLLFGMTSQANGAERVLKTQANVMVELTLAATRHYQDPFNEVTLDVVFIDPHGQELRVPAFWDGGNVWKVRYASPVVGVHKFKSECSEKTDRGLQGITGKVEVKAYTGQNPLYLHGPMKVAADKRHLQYEDGTPFFWLGDTWWMGLNHRLHWPEDVQKLAADRKEKGFTVIQIVAGLYPDMHPFDPRGANEAGYPWETNYARIRPEYFDAADKRLLYLVDQGFMPCIVGAWGYFMPWMGVDKMKAHWRNLIARYGALPVAWCAAGEANLPWYLAKGFPYDDRKQVSDWTEVMRYMRETDPFHRPLTIHPTGIGRLSSRHAADDPGLLDFDMLQTPHGQRESVPVTINTVRESYADKPMMPVINGEASYEMLGDNLPTEWTRRMFWICMMNGAAGHTYGANGIWQVNRQGDPHGPSPHHGPGVGYGKIPWDEAMNLPGSRQVALGKKLFEQYPWQEFRPHPEWASYRKRSMLNFDGSQWIWFPEGNPAQNAPAEKRFFRRVFVVPTGKTISSAQIRISADDRFSASLNGANIGASDAGNNMTWKTGKQFDDLAPKLKAGTNVIAVEAENLPAGGANPAGLIARLEIRFADGETLRVDTDADWVVSKSQTVGWEQSEFDDSSWSKAMVVGKYGSGPWGQIDTPGGDDIQGPQSAGIPGVVRMIYVPDSEAVSVQNLGRRARYTVKWFDPVSGAKTQLSTVQGADAAAWVCQPPAGISHDWVLILEPEKPSKTLNSKSAHDLILQNDKVAWCLNWSDGRLRTLYFENKLSGHRFAVSRDKELAFNFSSAVDHVAQPYTRAADFEVRDAEAVDAQQAIINLHSASLNIDVAIHVQLDGPTRRKWAVVTNRSGKELLLLDAELDDFTVDGLTSGGGEGDPVFVEGELFAAIEHPAGVSHGDKGRVQLAHYPGKRIAPGGTFRTHTSLVSVAKAGEAQEYFVNYIQSKSLRPKKSVSIYTPFGINNQWGACPTGDDEQVLNILGELGKWQKRGMKFDYFSLDTGWIDPNSDLKRFRPTCFPNGPGEIVRRANAEGMKFGLWFATSWAAESSWDYPALLSGQPNISMPYRLGYPDKAHEGQMFCFATEPYFKAFKEAILYHVHENHARLLKFDGGNYHCDNPAHGHLTGIYSVEPMYANLIDVATSARAIAPDVFIMWYWGLHSPFWALYGDLIFESGLQMEGSATSSSPTLYYRDSVTLAQDQNAQNAKLIPPFIKDSLGVWLADNRWGNFMGKERWREALVMDLGRGDMFFPNIWGNLYHLNEADVDFLTRMNTIAKKNEALFVNRKNLLGNPFRNEVYGYAHSRGDHGFLFLNNDHFTSRHAELRLDKSVGLEAKAGTTLRVISHFPETAKLLRPDGTQFKAGDTLGIWLRPFETLMLEVSPSVKEAGLPVRAISKEQAADLGMALPLKRATLASGMDVRFVDAGRFEGQGLKKKVYAFESTLPSLTSEPPILAVAIKLKKGGAEWKHAPTVAEIAQAVVRIGDEDVQMIPVPDGRQFGNTQSFGSSWVVYKLRLGQKWSHKPVKLVVHVYLPDGGEADVEAWVTKRWWEEDGRPSSDGYYNDAAS